MSALLKSGSDALRARVRPIGGTAPAPEPVPIDPELAQLRAALAEAHAALKAQCEMLDAVPARLEAARADGEEAGRALAQDREAERIDILRKAANEAMTLYARQMQSLDRLAALLARTCLEKMLLDDVQRADIIAGLLRGQMAKLEAGAAVRIEVSDRDFPDAGALAALAPAPCEIIASPALASGDCTIKLRLGTIEIGLGQQWGTLRSALEEMGA